MVTVQELNHQALVHLPLNTHQLSVGFDNQLIYCILTNASPTLPSSSHGDYLP